MALSAAAATANSGVQPPLVEIAAFLAISKAALRAAAE